MKRARIIEIGTWDAFYSEREHLLGKTIGVAEILPITPEEWIAGHFILLENASYYKAGDKITFARVKIEFLKN